MNRLFRPTLVAALGTAASRFDVAHANVEIGGTAGIHVFSDTNELGVPDVNDATSERNSALFGLRIGVYVRRHDRRRGRVRRHPERARASSSSTSGTSRTARTSSRSSAPRSGQEARPVRARRRRRDEGHRQQERGHRSRRTPTPTIYAGVGAKYRVDNGWGLRADARLLFPPSSTGRRPDDRLRGSALDLQRVRPQGSREGRRAADRPNDDPDKRRHRRTTPTSARTRPRTRTASRTTTAAPTRTTTATASPDAHGQVPDRGRGQGRLPGRRRLPGSGQRRRRHPGRGRQVPERGRGQGRLPGRRRLPRSGQRRRRRARRAGQVRRRAGDQERLPGRRRLPRRGPGEVKQFTGVIQGINFKVELGGPPPGSNKTLDKAVAVLKEFPDLKLESRATPTTRRSRRAASTPTTRRCRRRAPRR